MSSVHKVPETLPTPFDRLTALVCAALEVPFGLVSVLEGDDAFYRFGVGLGQKVKPRDDSISAKMVEMGAGATLVVLDACLDDDLCRHPFVTGQPGIRFLACVTICDGDGTPVGALGAMDVVPRDPPTPAQMAMLGHIAGAAGDLLDEMKSRRATAEQFALLELAEEMAGLGRWRYDITNGKVDWSDEVYRIHGRDRATFDPSYADALNDYHPEDREILAACVDRAIETGEGYNIELRLISATRGERLVTTRARTERDEAGRTVALFGVFQDVTETVTTQERLRSSEALFQVMSETSTDIVARYDMEGRFLYVSPAVRTVLGREPEDLLGSDCSAFVPAEDIARFRALLGAYCEAGPAATPPRYEYRARKADGSWVWLEATPRVVRDQHGQVVEFHDCMRDVTAAKTAGREQQELIDTLKLAENVAGLGCWKLDVATGQVNWSDQTYRIHGVTPQTFDPSLDDAVGFYHPDDQQAVRDWCAKAIETGEAAEFRLRLIRADGQERIVISQCRPERGRDGATTALFGVFQDVTERVLADEHIRASEARYRLLADNATDIIAIYGMDGVFRYLSPAIEGPMGYRPDELEGQRFEDFMHADDVARVQAAFADYVRAGPGAISPRVPYRGACKDGSFVWLEAHPKVIRDETGRPVEIQDVVRDISQTKAMEDELIAARDVAEAAARSKTEFLANMSHELRTPLTSVIGFSGLLRGSANLPAAERTYAERIATASDSLLGVINDILDYSKLEAEAVDLDPQPFDPRTMAHSAATIIEDQCRTKGLTLDVEVADALAPVLMGDGGRLRQVTLNLLSNAVKFTGTGTVTLRVANAAGRLRVAVTDSGIGIPPDKIDKLFDRFTQADASTTRVYGGTGLGLAISRRLVEMMGGQIGAESTPGEGSTFWFEVPLIVAGVEAEAPTPVVAGLPSDTRILMADDAPANRELVTAILAGFDLDLETVQDGAEAVEAARSGTYDLILMDVHMPVMDGLDATRAIRAMGGRVGRTPIVALTANVQPEHVERCREAGMDGHVGKPIQVGQLLQTIANALGQRGDREGQEAAA